MWGMRGEKKERAGLKSFVGHTSLQHTLNSYLGKHQYTIVVSRQKQQCLLMLLSFHIDHTHLASELCSGSHHIQGMIDPGLWYTVVKILFASGNFLEVELPRVIIFWKRGEEKKGEGWGKVSC